MPRLRNPPILETERRISVRFRELRELRHLSQPEFGQILSVTRDRIANVECGRAPLRYHEARQALEAGAAAGSREPTALPFNPLWLAGKQDWPIQLSWPMLLPDPTTIGISPTLRFSEFVTENLALLQSFASDSPAQVRLPESWLEPYLRHWSTHQVYAERAEQAAFTLMEILAQSSFDLSPVSAPARRVFQEFKSTSQGAAFLEVERWARSKRPSTKESSKRVLTDTETPAKLASVKSQLDNLLADLNRLSEGHRKKTELAEFLGAPLASVSRWLSGEREPGGETTLRLIQWVEQQERQQKKGPGSATTPPEPKTQSKVSNEKKPESGRKKC